MPTFKEKALADLDVFVNPDEMGENLTIDGNPVKAVVDVRKGSPEGDPGVNISEFEIRLKASDLALPKSGQELVINGETHTVGKVELTQGLLTIFTYRYES